MDQIIFGAPDIRDDEIEEVVATLRSGWLGTGPKVERFEREFAEYQGVDPQLVVALNSCTAALHLALLAADVGGGEVITTPMTFCATVNAIIHAGATPVLVDIDPNSLNLDVAQVAEKINDQTKAILPVHFAGNPCAMDELRALAEAHNLMLIEDCAHAIEGRYGEKACGTMGNFGCFSFYVTKNVVCGEGGMLIANDTDAATKLRQMSLHGLSLDASKRFGASGYRHYDLTACGFKYNMMDLQAALGIHQLSRVEENLRRREVIWSQYNDAFSDLPLILPPEADPNARHARHLYTVRLESSEERDDIITRIKAFGVGVGVHYVALTEYRFYQEKFAWDPDDYPVARDVGRTTLSLPLGPSVTDSDVRRVIDAVSKLVTTQPGVAVSS